MGRVKNVVSAVGHILVFAAGQAWVAAAQDGATGPSTNSVKASASRGNGQGGQENPFLGGDRGTQLALQVALYGMVSGVSPLAVDSGISSARSLLEFCLHSLLNTVTDQSSEAEQALAFEVSQVVYDSAPEGFCPEAIGPAAFVIVRGEEETRFDIQSELRYFMEAAVVADHEAACAVTRALSKTVMSSMDAKACYSAHLALLACCLAVVGVAEFLVDKQGGDGDDGIEHVARVS